MVTSELNKIDTAAVAQADEIHRLSRFLSPYQQPRSFSKDLLECLASNGSEAMSSEYGKRAPFHHLRDEFGLLLGISGSNLVLTTWERHELELTESSPERLRPALLKLFSTAARIAAPRGNSQALKSLLRGFEAGYFPIAQASLDSTSAHNHRFSLLALIQTGRGASLLQAIGVTPPIPTPSAAAPAAPPLSQTSEADRVKLRREFLFEASVRSKSWTEAYRQSRLLTYGNPRPDLSPTMERRVAEVYRMNLDTATPASKKKQLLADIARLPADYDEQPEEFALRAVSSVATSCRPGEDDALICKLLSPADPRWRLSLRRLYRHKPCGESWTLSLRRLWQHEPTLRPYCRLLFSLLRFSRRRAEVALAAVPIVDSSERLEGVLLRARLQRCRQEVQSWSSLLGASRPSDVESDGAAVNVRRTLWDHIGKVCQELGLTVPQRVRVVSRFDNVSVRTVGSETELVVSPIFLSTREGEARFLVARALFRHAVGLEQVESRGRELATWEGLAERAEAYAEWMSHDLQALRGLRSASRVAVEELQVALEEMHWRTGDRVYSSLCEVLANRCWCPRAELEADIFAHRYCDLIDATYAVLGSGLACLPLYRDCESHGIGGLSAQLKDYPALVLRLQNLWMSGSEEVQKNLRAATR